MNPYDQMAAMRQDTRYCDWTGAWYGQSMLGARCATSSDLMGLGQIANVYPQLSQWDRVKHRVLDKGRNMSTRLERRRRALREKHLIQIGTALAILAGAPLVWAGLAAIYSFAIRVTLG